MSQLAALSNASLSRLSHVAKRLESRGFLQREPDPDDGRYTRAMLTDAGMAKVVDSAKGHVAHVRELVFDALTPAQQRRLRDIIDAILNRVDPGNSNWPTPPGDLSPPCPLRTPSASRSSSRRTTRRATCLPPWPRCNARTTPAVTR
jgi:hypothetical protein